MKENIIFSMHDTMLKHKNYDFCKLQKYVEPMYFCCMQAYRSIPTQANILMFFELLLVNKLAFLRFSL